jgi:hypothetical protein
LTSASEALTGMKRVLWRMKVWLLGGMSVKLYGTMNTRTTDPWRLNRACRQFRHKINKCSINTNNIRPNDHQLFLSIKKNNHTTVSRSSNSSITMENKW